MFLFNSMLVILYSRSMAAENRRHAQAQRREQRGAQRRVQEDEANIGVFNSSLFFLSTDIFEQPLIVRPALRQAGVRSNHLHPTLAPKTHSFASESPGNDQFSQGTLKKAMQLYNVHTGKKAKVSRLVCMRSDEMEVCFSISSSRIRSDRLTRMSILLDLVKFTRCSVLNARLGILSQIVRVTSPWSHERLDSVHAHSKGVDIHSGTGDSSVD